MSKVGFYISRLQAVGSIVENAEVEFKEGLNIISGPSDTGKSYIFSCINFMLGAEDPPESIPEGKGYTDLLIEITTYDGRKFVLRRTLKSKASAYFMESSIDDMNNHSKWTELKYRHNENTLNNISAFLLLLADFKIERIQQNQRNKTRSVSFRDIVRFVMVDEERIITKNSPILSGQVIHDTVDKSAFRYILTGKGSGDLVEQLDPKIRKAKLNAKIEMLDKILDDLLTDMRKIPVKNIEERIQHIGNKTEELSSQISNNSSLINDAMAKKQLLWEKEQKAVSRAAALEELIVRFKLLEQHYTSDLGRIEFLLEGEYYLSQLNTIPCPVCGGDMQKHDLACWINENDRENVMRACGAESNKIKLHLKDLYKTVGTTEAELVEMVKNVKEFREAIEELDNYIQMKLEPTSKLAKDELQTYLKEQAELQEYQLNMKRVHELEKEKHSIASQLKAKEKPNDKPVNIDYDTFVALTDEIKQILKSWKYPKLSTVYFGIEKSDLEVSGQTRSSHGKGFRAIIFTALIFGIMQYCRKNGLAHPGFTILDSPLTTYRENDPADEDISSDMQKAFFDTLVTQDTNKQIIILENKEPSQSIQEQCNYIHFTGVMGKGRKGFFPQSINVG